MAESESEARKVNVDRLWGSMPWFKAKDIRRVRAKLFRSGNSLALRIPAGTKLSAGMEVDLTIEDGEFLSVEPIERPKRKFNIAKVAGSATSLDFIRDEDRVFEDRPLRWEA
ncbi:hypothetical protein [Sphingomonas sp. ID0503]|uniref:AbrB/MazE/SpoVT family DNA-binding domain-containing protein n=1 Tax=Sphingomonas sp. ID0503 TaxID=3399691 RepID=UPI003AFB6148